MLMMPLEGGADVFFWHHLHASRPQAKKIRTPSHLMLLSLRCDNVASREEVTEESLASAFLQYWTSTGRPFAYV